MANINKNKKYHFIYKTTNLINGGFYVGMHSTSNLSDGYLGSGKRLKYSIRKYGIENFKCEILEFLPDRESLIKREIKLVNEDLLKEEKCLNLKPGGKGGFCSSEHAYKYHAAGGKKVLKILSEKHVEKLKNDKSYREIFIKKISGHKPWLGKKHAEESKIKIGEKNAIKQKGELNSQYDTCWVYNNELKENNRIPKDMLNIYISKGWCKGRKMNFK